MSNEFDVLIINSMLFICCVNDTISWNHPSYTIIWYPGCIGVVLRISLDSQQQCKEVLGTCDQEIQVQ